MSSGRFDYAKFDDESVVDHAAFKELFLKLEYLVAQKLHEGRSAAMVLTHLEEAFMWVGKAIRDTQAARGGESLGQMYRGEQ